MGFIGAYESAKGRRYRARYTKPDGTPTEKRGFATKREAELFLSTVTVSKAFGNYIDPALSRVRVSPKLGSIRNGHRCLSRRHFSHWSHRGMPTSPLYGATGSSLRFTNRKSRPGCPTWPRAGRDPS